MSIDMYNDRNNNFPTRLALFDKALHSQCIIVDEKRYLSELWSFLYSLGLDDDNQ
jgi:hypothetical protein